MAEIDERGLLVSPRVRAAIAPTIERGRMSKVRGIIVHQTGSSTAASTLASYASPTNGAHFLIDKDGTVYQTASLHRTTWHVGKLRARCLAELRCPPAEATALRQMRATERNRHEMKKQVPERYPSNDDSIGIELVGQAFPLNEPDPDKRRYEDVPAAQNESLAWLVYTLRRLLGVPLTEVFRHPVVSQKNLSEAAGARW